MLGFSFCRTSILAPKMGNANLRLLMSALALLLVSVDQAHPQQNYDSASYVLPLCKTWLKLTVEGEVEEIGSASSRWRAHFDRDSAQDRSPLPLRG